VLKMAEARTVDGIKTGKFRWVDYAVVAAANGQPSPRHDLLKAIAEGRVRQIGRGLYEVTMSQRDDGDEEPDAAS
jgi:hypothetical protein